MEDDPLCGETADAPDFALAVELFAALAHPDRLRLILALGRDELTANHLADITEQSPGAVRQHLAALEVVGVVRSRRYHDRPFYRLSEPGLQHLVRGHVRLRNRDAVATRQDRPRLSRGPGAITSAHGRSA